MEGHLSQYNAVDIALDTFPYNGTTTTCEALSMGVPVITLAGQHHAGRVGMSLLTAIGLQSFIAADHEQYIMKTVELASDISTLCGLRKNLRNQLLHSPLCDAPAFTRQFEDALLDMWRSK
jgi:predicted O-linked N-acetylglucosamine transferase (SPINDLY family)